MRHDNIVNLLEVFRRKSKLYLVFEFVERSLLEDLERNVNGLDSEDAKKFTYQLLRALDHCHSHQVCTSS
jgi:cyclin-dependent kinase-like